MWGAANMSDTVKSNLQKIYEAWAMMDTLRDLIAQGQAEMKTVNAYWLAALMEYIGQQMFSAINALEDELRSA